MRHACAQARTFDRAFAAAKRLTHHSERSACSTSTRAARAAGKFAPMASANLIDARALNPGAFISIREPYRRSRTRVLIAADHIAPNRVCINHYACPQAFRRTNL